MQDSCENCDSKCEYCSEIITTEDLLQENDDEDDINNELNNVSRMI